MVGEFLFTFITLTSRKLGVGSFNSPLQKSEVVYQTRYEMRPRFWPFWPFKKKSLQGLFRAFYNLTILEKLTWVQKRGQGESKCIIVCWQWLVYVWTGILCPDLILIIMRAGARDLSHLTTLPPHITPGNWLWPTTNNIAATRFYTK